jgi:uncharacterized RDD family membrane protein YckC
VTPTAPPATDPGQTRFLTGEAVHLDVRVARVGSRALARLIDIVIQIVVFWTLVTAISLLATVGAFAGIVVPDSAIFSIVIILSLVGAFIGYPVLMETMTRGRTLGKLTVGLRVVRDDGGPITFRHALTRGLVGVAIEWPGIIGAPLTWLATIWAMIASPQSKRIGDHVAGTVVIHERTPAAWGWVPQMPPGMATWAATLDLTGLDDDLGLAVRHYLARNRQIWEPARTQLGQRLAREVAAVTNPPAPEGTPGWAYLAAVHAERHRRALRQLAAARTRASAVWPDLIAAIAAPQPVPPSMTPAPAPVPVPVPVPRPSIPVGSDQ